MTSQHVGHRRRHRERQEPDEPPPRFGRPARPARAPSSTPRTRPSTRRTGSASRASSSRSTATTAAASTSTSAARRPSGRRSTARRAESRSGDLVVESYVAGNDYRCLVIGGKVAAIAERVPASVIGDGEHTVRQLVDIANQDPRRGIGHEKVLTRIKLDEAAEELVRAQGFELDDVPPEGTRVKLALTGNMSTGGTSIDRTIEAHPDNVEIAETAAQIVGLDVAGIDFICPDIATPGPRDRRRDRRGQRRARASGCTPTRPRASRSTSPGRSSTACSRPARPSRIPIIAVTGTNGKTTTVRMIAHILKLKGRRVGMTSTDGIVIDGRLIKKGDMSGPKSAQMVLQNPTVDTAVFEVARGGILREGLGYDRNDVAVVTNVTGDHLGLGGIDSIGQLANVKGVDRRGGAALGDARSSTPTTATSTGWAATAPAGSSCSACRRRRARTASTGSTATPRRGNAAFVPPAGARGRADRPPPRPADDAGPLHPPDPGDVRRAGPDERRERARRGGGGLGGGRPPPRHPPGPADVLDVVLPGAGPAQPARRRRDPGRHRLLPQRRRDAPAGRLRRADDDRAAVEGRPDRAVVERPRAGRGRAIGVIGIPGDRRDDDQREYGAIAATAFDEIIVREDKNLRGRAPGEIGGERRSRASARLAAAGRAGDRRPRRSSTR